MGQRRATATNCASPAILTMGLNALSVTRLVSAPGQNASRMHPIMRHGLSEVRAP